LICLRRINGQRISDRDEGEAKRMKLNDGGSSSSSSGSSSSSDVVLWRSSRISGDSSSSSSRQTQQRREFKGVLAESKITAFEMWREMVIFL